LAFGQLRRGRGAYPGAEPPDPHGTVSAAGQLPANAGL